jgi:uncharacterized membrane protein
MQGVAAMTCLDWLGHTLCQLCERQFPAFCRRDSSGTPRLLSTPLSFERLLDSAFNAIREYGRRFCSLSLAVWLAVFWTKTPERLSAVLVR